MLNKNIFRIILVTVFILTLPLIAMQFTNQVAWTFSDFVIAGTLLFGSGLVYENLSKKIPKHNKITIGIFVLVLLIWLWAELAVGIFTNWGS